MTGTEVYNDEFEKRARKRIAKYDSSWMLEGFYNSLVINKSYATSYNYLCTAISFLETVKNISKINVDSYYNYMASVKGKSSSTQIAIYHALQRYSKYLCSRRACEDYMQFVDRPKYIETQQTKDKREIGYLTKEETKLLFDQVAFDSAGNKIDACWRNRDYALLMIFLNTGIRLSAMFKLDVSDVDLDNCTITVFEKGSKARKIDISDKTVDAIDDWLLYRGMELGLDSKETALFISREHNRMSINTIGNRIKVMGKAITGKNITPHKLRATYGTQLYAATHDIYFVQKRMGHSSPTTTELYVRGQDKDAAKRASDIMMDFLDEG